MIASEAVRGSKAFDILCNSVSSGMDRLLCFRYAVMSDIASTMTRKPKPQVSDPAEYKRFLETAKAVEASDDPKAFDRAFKKVMSPHPQSPKKDRL